MYICLFIPSMIQLIMKLTNLCIKTKIKHPLNISITYTFLLLIKTRIQLKKKHTKSCNFVKNFVTRSETKPIGHQRSPKTLETSNASHQNLSTRKKKKKKNEAMIGYQSIFAIDQSHWMGWRW